MRKAHRRSFDCVEDCPDSVQQIRRIVQAAVHKAARESRENGWTAICTKGNQVLCVVPDGEEKVITVIERSCRRYKPGQVLYARRS